MAQDTKIEWAHDTANLWWGCTEVHAGCDNCYARVFANRYKNSWGGSTLWGNNAPRRAIKGVWDALAKMQKKAQQAGEIRRVFVGSMMDIFEKPMLLQSERNYKLNTGEIREKFFEQITNGLYPNLMFLLLTKRPSNINKYIPETWKTNPPTNVMFGTSVVNQETADKLIPQLLLVKGKRFLSIEPQLDAVDIWRYLNRTVHMPNDSGCIDWVIQGGESGHHKRPFNLDWARTMRDQCLRSGVPYFFKQIDKIQDIPGDLMIRQFPNTHEKTKS